MNISGELKIINTVEQIAEKRSSPMLLSNCCCQNGIQEEKEIAQFLWQERKLIHLQLKELRPSIWKVEENYGSLPVGTSLPLPAETYFWWPGKWSSKHAPVIHVYLPRFSLVLFYRRWTPKSLQTVAAWPSQSLQTSLFLQHNSPIPIY